MVEMMQAATAGPVPKPESPGRPQAAPITLETPDQGSPIKARLRKRPIDSGDRAGSGSSDSDSDNEGIRKRHQSRRSASPTESAYERYVKMVEAAPNKTTMVNKVSASLLKDYGDQGYHQV